MPGGDVIADRVMTDSGVQVGTVTDVVIDTATGSVVGYEVLPADEPEQRQGRRSYLPLPETGAVSGEALIVPASAIDYIATDLAGFGEAIDRYRDLLRGGSLNLSDLTDRPVLDLSTERGGSRRGGRGGREDRARAEHGE